MTHPGRVQVKNRGPLLTLPPQRDSSLRRALIARSHGWLMAVVGRFEACPLIAGVAWAPERRGTGASWPVGKGPEASGLEPSPISSLAADRLSVQNRASVAAPRHQSSGARLPTFEPTCPNPNFRRACHFFAPEHDAMIRTGKRDSHQIRWYSFCAFGGWFATRPTGL